MIYALALFFAVLRDSKLETLVSAHENGLGQIQTVEVEIDLKAIRPRTDHVKLTWIKKGRLERQTYFDSAVPPRDDGRPMDRGDMLEDGKTLKVLQNYNWDDPQPLHPRNQGSVKAWYQPQERGMAGPFRNSPGFLGLFNIHLIHPQDARRTLRQLVTESPKAVVKGQATVSGHTAWHLVIEHPDTKTNGPFSGSVYELYLDPAVNYLVRRLYTTTYWKASDGSMRKRFGPMYEDREVTEFKEYDNGVFFPMEVTYNTYMNDPQSEPAQEARITVASAKINEPLPDSKFDFVFPENALVYEMPVLNNRHRIQLWGPDNKPIKRISAEDDLGPYPDVAPAEKRGLSLLQIAFIAVPLVMAIGAVIYFRRRAA